MKHFRISIIILIAFLGLYLYTLVSSPLPYSVIDTDNSGIVSITEALNASEIGTRSLIKENETCIDYYWLKDGLSAYQDCKAHQ
ncbi:hypothetical protein [Thalassotalea sp. PLHSN55]|uniref:hypothetical protein n=1 Tax=Thalassotalea sp. PLHSN55 TaxID=3435888 RepID=UPI003F846151